MKYLFMWQSVAKMKHLYASIGSTAAELNVHFLTYVCMLYCSALAYPRRLHAKSEGGVEGGGEAGAL